MPGPICIFLAAPCSFTHISFSFICLLVYLGRSLILCAILCSNTIVELLWIKTESLCWVALGNWDSRKSTVERDPVHSGFVLFFFFFKHFYNHAFKTLQCLEGGLESHSLSLCVFSVSLPCTHTHWCYSFNCSQQQRQLSPWISSELIKSEEWMKKG